MSLRRLRWNGWKIARETGLSRATVSRILRRAGMNRLRSLDPPPPVVGYEHKHPGDLIHFDIKRLARIVKPAIVSTATAPGWPSRPSCPIRSTCPRSASSIWLAFSPRASACPSALREWAYARSYQNSLEREIQLDSWLHAYNFHPPPC